MLAHLDFSSIFAAPNLQHLGWGLQYTALLTVTSWVLAVALGTVMATLRTMGNPLVERLVAGYVAYHQNVPMLAQLFRYGRLRHHGAFFNAKTGQMCALPIDPGAGRDRSGDSAFNLVGRSGTSSMN